MNFHRVLFGVVALFPWIASAATTVLSERMVHLRSGDVAEWDSFTNSVPVGRRLDLPFNAHSNRTEASLFIRHDDVKLDWFVELNGNRIGKLFAMEADLIHTLAVPPGALREGSNHLAIIPPRENDDIIISRVWLDERTSMAARSEAMVQLAATDQTGRPVPCRFTIVTDSGALAPVYVRSNALVAARPGVVYSANGLAQVNLPAGDYTVFASRGFEWSVATKDVHVASGARQQLSLRLRSEVQTDGFVNCDTHVHTFTHSRHGDATTEERCVTLAGEGIELPIATDHNLHIDYTPTARATGTAKFFTPVMGNEVTTAAGHFNIFPIAPGARIANEKLTNWAELMPQLRGTPGVRVVVLNHPRNIHNKFQPFAAQHFNDVTGENKRGGEFTFDAMELLNSSALQSDDMLVVRDWFALWNYGYRITGVGSSDGHDVSRYIIGQGRTYIACDDDEVSRISIESACSNLVAGRAVVSLGLLAQIQVNERFTSGDLATNVAGELRVNVRVFGPSWITATNVALFANGVKVREAEIARVANSITGLKTNIAWTLPRPAHDVFLVAIATGPGVSAPFWAMAKPYQPSSPHWEPRVMSITNPVRVDADGDGQFTSARGYAKQLVAQHRTRDVAMRAALAFEEPVRAHVQALWRDR